MNVLLLLAALAAAEPILSPADATARTEQLIADYAKADAMARKEAKAELLKLGPAAQTSLKKHLDDKDPEIAALAKELSGASAAKPDQAKTVDANKGEQVIQLGNGGVMRVRGGGNVQMKVIANGVVVAGNGVVVAGNGVVVAGNGVVVAGNGAQQIPPELLELMLQQGMQIPPELLGAKAKPADKVTPLNLGKADPEVQAKVDTLLKTISEGDAPARKQAKADLRALGAPAAAALASRSNDKDPEVAAVAKELTAELAPAAGKVAGKDKNGVEIIEGPNGRTVIHRAQRIVVNGQEVDEMPPEMAARMAAMEDQMAVVRAQHAQVLKQAGLAVPEVVIDDEPKAEAKVEAVDVQAAADKKAAELAKQKAEAKP